ncbi:MAG: hypothetical protein JWP77_193, partial [Polaromonas sp.]|nr:hypothetical protein [Polaromonas sp.]
HGVAKWPASRENTNLAFRQTGDMIEFANNIFRLNSSKLENTFISIKLISFIKSKCKSH